MYPMQENKKKNVRAREGAHDGVHPVGGVVHEHSVVKGRANVGGHLGAHAVLVVKVRFRGNARAEPRVGGRLALGYPRRLVCSHGAGRGAVRAVVQVDVATARWGRGGSTVAPTRARGCNKQQQQQQQNARAEGKQRKQLVPELGLRAGKGGKRGSQW